MGPYLLIWKASKIRFFLSIPAHRVCLHGPSSFPIQTALQVPDALFLNHWGHPAAMTSWIILIGNEVLLTWQSLGKPLFSSGNSAKCLQDWTLCQYLSPKDSVIIFREMWVIGKNPVIYFRNKSLSETVLYQWLKEKDKPIVPYLPFLKKASKIQSGSELTSLLLVVHLAYILGQCF